LLGEKKCKADYIHSFGKGDLLHEKTVSHVRLNIYPDGGVSRLRIFGQPVI
jgi:allantoicase